MKDEKKVKATEEEAKKEVQTEEDGEKLTDEEMSEVVGGNVLPIYTPVAIPPMN